MNDQSAQTKLLGTFRRCIAGRIRSSSTVSIGDALLLIREPENEYDENAIRIESEQGEKMGYIPRNEARWIAPLLDERRIHLEGRAVAEKLSNHRIRLQVMVSVYLVDESILHARTPQSSQDVSHQMVVQAYNQLDRYNDPALVDELESRLRGAVSGGLPETQLLLALFPMKAEAIHKRISQQFKGNLEKAFAGLVSGDPIRNNGFGIIPIYNRNPCQKRILLLNRAIQDELIQVKETTTSGEVQNISVTNQGPDPILIPEGEILIGAKQNRVVNVSILLGGHSRLNIPVSCVEQGRWRYEDIPHFKQTAKAPPKLRGKNMKFVKESLKSKQGFTGNQKEVWSEVYYCLASTDTPSSTDSLVDSYEKNQEYMRSHREKLVCPKDAVGFIFLRDGKPIGLDIYANAEMLEQSWDRLIESYLSDALFYGNVEAGQNAVAPLDLLKNLKESLLPSQETLGLGQRFISDKSIVEGSCLIDGSDVCHLSAFIVE